MPFTPFHAGLGLAAKAIAPTLVSLQAFTLAQITMDIEPGVQMFRGVEPLHGWTHTFSGSLVVGAATFALWRLLQGRRIYRWTLPRLSSSCLFTSILLGVWTHVALDALIHHDMVSTRQILGLTNTAVKSHEFAQWICVAAATAGVIALALRWRSDGLRQIWLELKQNLARRPAWFSRDVN